MCRTRSALALVMLFVGLVHPWDIAIGNGDLLDFYVHKTKTNTVHFKSQNLAALAYDEVHDMILYVDKQSDNDAICGFSITSTHYKYLTERNGRNIQGIAFDPVTELLFFTDTKERSINWISLKPGFKNNVYGNVLLKMDDGIPTDIAVDSCGGLIYWINTNLTTPTIERARFNGSYREVVIKSSSFSVNSTYKLEPHSLAIDQRSQRIYWVEPVQGSSNFHFDIYSADLNGQNKKTEVGILRYFGDTDFSHPSNTLTVLKESICIVAWCLDCSIWLFGLYSENYRFNLFLEFPMKVPVSLVANYKVSDQVKGSRDCKPLKSLVQNNSLTNDTFKIATEYVEEFCVHGVHVDGLSPCKCSPGYIGERCDVSVCENYCLQGSCSFNDDGLPKCRCNAGYSGERCEVNLCHGYCQHDGDCSLNNQSKPVCECKENFAGDRCEVSACLNYCSQGSCTVNDEGLPKCRCNAGYSGERCEVNLCLDYCQNDGDCSLNNKSEPVCECKENFAGVRCEVSACLNYCFQGSCTVNDEGLPKCRCDVGYSGERCEINLRHGYCQNDGNGSLNNKSEPVGECKENYAGFRCEVSACLNYCFKGNCSVNDEGLPKCRCDVGYSGERCEVNLCHGYCLNGGECSINEEDELVCQCVDNYDGERCEATKNVNFKNTRTSFTADRNLTLADLLSNWRKPISKVTVIMESS